MTQHPVEVRLIGHPAAVRAAAAAIEAGGAAGPVSYRQSRYGDGLRAYLTVVMDAPDDAPGPEPRAVTPRSRRRLPR